MLGAKAAGIIQQASQPSATLDSYSRYNKGAQNPNAAGSEPKKSSAINQYASAARMMPQNTIANSSLAQHSNHHAQQQTSVFNSAHGSTMMDQNLLQNLTLQQNPAQNLQQQQQLNTNVSS